MKKIIFSLFLLIQIPLKAKTSVTYSEAADVFEIMDHVSLWTTKLSPEIRRYWEKKFGAIGGEDENLLERYISIRRKSDRNFANYLSEGSPEISLFGETGISSVPMSMAFYNSKSVGEALKKVAPYLKTEDFKFLKKFYKHFQPKITEMVKESTSFKAHLVNHNNALKKVHNDKVLKRLATFLGLKTKGKIKFLLTWWPPEKEPFYEARGNTILLRYHPLSGAKVWDGQGLLKAGVSTLMAQMSPNQKSNATTIFNRHCIGRSLEFNHSMEILWSRLLPSKWTQKKKFTLYQDWNEDGFTNLYVKLLFPLIQESLDTKQNIEGTFIHQAARLCGELHKLATPPSFKR